MFTGYRYFQETVLWALNSELNPIATLFVVLLPFVFFLFISYKGAWSQVNLTNATDHGSKFRKPSLNGANGKLLELGLSWARMQWIEKKSYQFDPGSLNQLKFIWNMRERIVQCLHTRLDIFLHLAYEIMVFWVTYSVTIFLHGSAKEGFDEVRYPRQHKVNQFNRRVSARVKRARRNRFFSYLGTETFLICIGRYLSCIE